VSAARELAADVSRDAGVTDVSRAVVATAGVVSGSVGAAATGAAAAGVATGGAAGASAFTTGSERAGSGVTVGGVAVAPVAGDDAAVGVDDAAGVVDAVVGDVVDDGVGVRISHGRGAAGVSNADARNGAVGAGDDWFGRRAFSVRGGSGAVRVLLAAGGFAGPCGSADGCDAGVLAVPAAAVFSSTPAAGGSSTRVTAVAAAAGDVPVVGVADGAADGFAAPRAGAGAGVAFATSTTVSSVRSSVGR
jgi:hypothetical protein